MLAVTPPTAKLAKVNQTQPCGARRPEEPSDQNRPTHSDCHRVASTPPPQGDL